MSITNEEIIADIQKATMATTTIEDINRLGMKYSYLTYHITDDVLAHNCDLAVDVMASILNIRFGNEGSMKYTVDDLEQFAYTPDTVH